MGTRAFCLNWARGERVLDLVVCNCGLQPRLWDADASDAMQETVVSVARTCQRIVACQCVILDEVAKTARHERHSDSGSGRISQVERALSFHGSLGRKNPFLSRVRVF